MIVFVFKWIVKVDLGLFYKLSVKECVNIYEFMK